MTSREKLLRIAEQVHSDAKEHAQIAILMEKERKYILHVANTGNEEACASFLSQIEAECPELRLGPPSSSN